MCKFLCFTVQRIIRQHTKTGWPGWETWPSFPQQVPGVAVCRAAAPHFSSSFTTNMTKFGNLTTDSGVQALNEYLGDRSYVEGWVEARGDGKLSAPCEVWVAEGVHADSSRCPWLYQWLLWVFTFDPPASFLSLRTSLPLQWSPSSSLPSIVATNSSGIGCSKLIWLIKCP